MALQRFDRIIGQKDAVSFLQNAVRTGHVPHALILCGERGIGKMDLAMAFAGALQCAQSPAHMLPAGGQEVLPDPREPGRENPSSARLSGPQSAEPCGHCRSCKQIAAGSHPDVIVVTNARAGAETKTNIIGVKAARFVQGDVSIRPYEGPYKIYIVPDAQNMNPQAQNALLKTLEEPPAYAVLILLAQTTAAFLPTVLSRCITLNLRPVSEDELAADLIRRSGSVRAAGADDPGSADAPGSPAQEKGAAAAAPKMSEERALLCARLAHGNPGRCRQLAQDGTLWTFRADFISFIKRLPDVSSYEIVQYAERLTAKEDNRVDDFFDLGLAWFRDFLAAKSTDTAHALIFADEITYINKVKDQLSYAALGRILKAFDDAAQRRAAKGNDTQILEVLLLNVRRAMSRR